MLSVDSLVITAPEVCMVVHSALQLAALRLRVASRSAPFSTLNSRIVMISGIVISATLSPLYVALCITRLRGSQYHATAQAQSQAGITTVECDSGHKHGYSVADRTSVAVVHSLHCVVCV